MKRTYFESLRSLVPAKLVRRNPDGTITLKITAARDGYHRGEEITTRPWFFVHALPGMRCRPVQLENYSPVN